MKFQQSNSQFRKRQIWRRSFLLVVSLLMLNIALKAQESVGTIKGKLVDVSTKEGLAGANVLVENTNFGAATDVDGSFQIPFVPVGSYNLSFQYIGYNMLTKTDIIVRPGRITFCNAELNDNYMESEAIIVEAGYFQDVSENSTSAIQFNSEEIRRSPGSAGDVSRILLALPSTAQVYDNSNDLMVRGGSPFENGFYVDNIPIPNVNHFPVQGASGGPIGLLNVDLIEDVSFYTGGFSPAYGNRLSSVIDIDFREGNIDEIDTQIDLSMGGFGGVVEGPFTEQKGSWFLSARRSYLDFIVDAIGTGIAPRYGDIQGKLSYDINPHNRFTLINIFGNSIYEISKKKANDLEQDAYGKTTTYQNTLGLNWRHLWESDGYSNTSLSYSFIKGKKEFFESLNDKKLNSSNHLDGEITFRNINYYRINKTNKMEYGFEGNYEIADYNYIYNSFTNRFGNEIPALSINDNFNSWKTGAFFNYIWNYENRITFTWGARNEYFSSSGLFHGSPRISVAYNVNEKLTLNGAYSEFFQSLPTFILSQDKKNKKLKDPKSVHYILGLEYLLSPDTRLTFELYNKEYKNFPLTPDDPAKFVVDDGRSMSLFGSYQNLQDIGIAYSRGAELMIQKRLVNDFYGLASVSLFRSRYRDLNKKWRDRIYDNQFLVSVIGGYKPNNKWEFSFRWNFAGGVPYSPFDKAKSSELNTGIINREKINESRYPTYHSMNIRFDRRYFFSKSSLVTYLSIWNVYNRKNVAAYYWNENQNKQDVMYQWSMIPIGGIEFEF
jgi:outer membrane receptor for ferrienterochelin and colicin